MTYPELEGLMEGMEKNSQRENAELGSTKHGDANDLIESLGAMGGI